MPTATQTHTKREKIMDTFETKGQLYFCVKVVSLFAAVEKLHLLI